MRGEESGHHLQVLLGLEAARRIDDPPPGPDAPGGVRQQADLHGRHPLELGGIQTPPELHPSAQNAGVRAGCIHKDAVKPGSCIGKGGDGRHTGRPEASRIFPKQIQTSFRGVMGHDPPRVRHPLGHVKGLAAWRGTEIQQGFTGTRVEFTDGQESAWILEVESSLPEAAQTGNCWDAGQLVQGAGFRPVEDPLGVNDFFGVPAEPQFLGVGLQTVHAGEDRGRCVDPSTERLQFLRVVPGRPPLDEPGRERPPPRRLRALQLLEAVSGGFAIPDDVPEDGIHKPGLAWKPEAACQLDRVMDRCVVGYPVEPEQLVDPETEQGPWNHWDRTPISASGDQIVEGSAPSEHPEDELLREATIGRFEADEHAVLLESTFREIPGFLLSDKKQDGKFSWFGNHREGILTVLR